MSEQKTHAETIADIIAEKRREANYIVQVSQGKCQTRRDKAEDEARDIRREADRLEAANRRERGDCAKLREALKQASELNDLWFDTFSFPDGATSIHDEIEDIISAALDAPPRNCDKYSHDKALRVWASEKENERNGCFDEWLYEIAKEGDEK